MIRDGYKQNRLYWNRGGEIKYIVVDLTDLTLMSAMIDEFFFF
jgi:anti-anti-sigma regulatory factor